MAVVVAGLMAVAVAATPVFVEVSPADRTVTTNGRVILEGTVTGASALDLNGTAVALAGSRFVTLPFVLHEGTNTFVLTAVDDQGGSAQVTHRVERHIMQHNMQHDVPPSPRMNPMTPAAVVAKTGGLIAQYGYRGAHALETKTVGGLTTQITFDAARRPVHIQTGAPNAPPVHSERIAWDPRGLKNAIQRDDLGGAGHLMAHDGAHRLLASARVGQPLALVGSNALADVTSVTGHPNHEAFTYDSAMNLTDRLVSESGVITEHPTPNDVSGRNRPASVNGKPLVWDANGNLQQKGDMVMSYDFRNRLTTVQRGGEMVVKYAYDALNRRVAREANGVLEEYAWDGNQEIETTRDGVLTSRRVYGANIDETVLFGRDTTGDGTIDSSYLTVYGSSNNLAAVTTLAGKPIERYEASAFGERRILVDRTPPAVEQVRAVGDALWLEISESVIGAELDDALADGTLRLRDIVAGDDLAVTVEQPVQSGGQALRRIVLTPDTVPDVGTSLELVIEPGVLVDSFANTPSSTYTLPVTWPGADAVVTDTAPPRVGAAIMRDGVVELELSEEVDPASTAITIDGSAVAWTSSGDHYTLVADQALATGSHTLAIDTTPLDLAGSGLAELFQVTFAVADQDARFAYVAPDERETAVSTLGNDIGFHGRPVDEATGLMYFRNRWFDPEMGRFVTPDPLGYVDGPSMYQFANYSPANYSDPLGLDSFIIRYGEAESEVDVYSTVRFVAWDHDVKMTKARLDQVQEDFLASVSGVWDGLNLSVIMASHAVVDMLPNRTMKYSSNEPFVRDVIVASSYGDVSSDRFYLDDMSPWTYAHEFGHHLGIRDMYDKYLATGSDGKTHMVCEPNDGEFGSRAARSIMGNCKEEFFAPSAEDYADILDPSRSRFELSMRRAPVHHIDLSAQNLGSAIDFFREVGSARSVDLEVQLEKLRQTSSPAQRRFVARWIMNALFR